ncbi:MAG: hypothetical protein ACW98Y_11115, partial [Candidatus Thorarchaeota archaeon]
IPSSLLDEEQKRSLRIERAGNITASWSTTGHTGANVPLFVFGEVFDNYSDGNVIENTDIFYELLGYYSRDATFRNDTSLLETQFDIPTLLIGVSLSLVIVLILVLFIRRKHSL